MQLVDTNVVSELMRRKPDAGVLAWMLTTEAARARLFVSAVTVDEIVYGLFRKPNPARLAWFDRFLVRHEAIAVTDIVARRAGEMRGTFAACGQVRSQADMLIAATAQVRAFTIVTRNVRDFEGCGIGVLNPFAV